MESSAIFSIVLFVIFLSLLIGIAIVFIIKEPFKHSDQPEVNTIDGVCVARHESISDFVNKPYPYYETGSYFKPLNTTKSIDFEQNKKTSLYTPYV